MVIDMMWHSVCVKTGGNYDPKIHRRMGQRQHNMSRFNTGNPLGSGSPLDLDDNAKNLDVLTNSREALSNPDRFGVQRKDLA